VPRYPSGWRIKAEASGYGVRWVGGACLHGQVRRPVLNPATVWLGECLLIGGGRRGRVRLGQPLLEVDGQDEHGREAGEYHPDDPDDVIPLRHHHVIASSACSVGAVSPGALNSEPGFSLTRHREQIEKAV
jgi:hypothetical protein